MAKMYIKGSFNNYKDITKFKETDLQKILSGLKFPIKYNFRVNGIEKRQPSVIKNGG